MPENEIIPDQEAVPEAGTHAPVETALAKFEREQLTRRQALRKFGITSAMATFAMFSVDDLARMVGKAMEQKARDNKMVEQVAQEFEQAGIAFAGAPSLPYGNCNQFQNFGGQNNCVNCNSDRLNHCNQTCMANLCSGAANCGYYACGQTAPTYAALQKCWSGVCAACLANCN